MLPQVLTCLMCLILLGLPTLIFMAWCIYTAEDMPEWAERLDDDLNGRVLK